MRDTYSARSPNLNPSSLPLSVLEYRFDCDDAGRLPAFPGSTWRGALGWSLKRAVCVIRDTSCRDCLLYRSCMFPYVFETPPPPDAEKLRKYPAAPHPFVLRIEPGQTGPDYRLGLVLIGRACAQLPYFVHALSEAGRHGIGRQRQPFQLREIYQATGGNLDAWTRIYAPDDPLTSLVAPPPAPPAIPERVLLRLTAPLRLKREDHLVTPATFRFADLFGSLLRRVSLLTYFHTPQPLEADFAGLVQRAGTVALHEPRLRWYDWTRYSSRQDVALDMGGLIGQVTLHGADLAEFWPYLWLGQWVHAGKGATLGLGRYQLEALTEPGLEARGT